MTILRISAVALAIALTTSGCATTGMDAGQSGNGQTSKASTGTAIGVAAGTILGAVLGGKGEGRYIGAAIGALAGGFLGNQLGQMLDEEDQKALQMKTAQALDAQQGQGVTTWSNQQKGVSADIQTGASTSEQHEVVMLRDKKVMAPPKLDLIGKTYVANTAVNVRAAPTKNSDVVNGLKAGENFTAVGKVVGQPWIAVAKNNRTIGYVAQSYVSAGTSAQQVATQSAMRAPSVKSTGSVDLDAMGMTGVDLDKEGIVVDKVAATTTCRPLTVEVKGKDGQTEKQSSKACRGTDGAWEIS